MALRRAPEPDRFTWTHLDALGLFQVKRESVSTLLIESKIHSSGGHLPGLASDSIKNDLALEPDRFTWTHLAFPTES